METLMISVLFFNVLALIGHFILHLYGGKRLRDMERRRARWAEDDKRMMAEMRAIVDKASEGGA